VSTTGVRFLTPEETEAQCRKVMASLQPSRGWDTDKARAEKLDEIDRLLDEWLAARG
jgi:hypothetical protein